MLIYLLRHPTCTYTKFSSELRCIGDFHATELSVIALLCVCDSDSQKIIIETLQQENAKFAESQAIEEVTRTVSYILLP